MRDDYTRTTDPIGGWDIPTPSAGMALDAALRAYREDYGRERYRERLRHALAALDASDALVDGDGK